MARISIQICRFCLAQPKGRDERLVAHVEAQRIKTARGLAVTAILAQKAPQE